MFEVYHLMAPWLPLMEARVSYPSNQNRAKTDAFELLKAFNTSQSYGIDLQRVLVNEKNLNQKENGILKEQYQGDNTNNHVSKGNKLMEDSFSI